MFFVARGESVCLGLRVLDRLEASKLYPAVIITAVPLGSIGGLLVSTVVTLLLPGLRLRKPQAEPHAQFRWDDDSPGTPADEPEPAEASGR